MPPARKAPYDLPGGPGEICCTLRLGGFGWGMIRGGFLSVEDRNKLIALARDGSAASRVTRRANALVLLDGGWSCQEVADALLLNDDTIRGWHCLSSAASRA